MKIQMKGKTAEVLLYEDVGGWFGVTADMFVREIRDLGDVSTINLRINSNGGNVFDGVAIYNYLRSHNARVEVDIDSLAASVASLIAMAGDEVRIASNAWMMVHDPYTTGARGVADDLRRLADTMEGVRDSMLDTYMRRYKKDRESMSAMMTEETWLSASQALEAGLVDASTPELEIAASVHSGWFRHPPERLATDTVRPLERPRAEYAKRIDARMKHVLRSVRN